MIFSNILNCLPYLHGFYNSTTRVLYCLHLRAALQISKKSKQRGHLPMTDRTPDTNTDKSDLGRRSEAPSMAQWPEMPLKSSSFYLHIIIHVLPPSFFLTSIHELTNSRKKKTKSQQMGQEQPHAVPTGRAGRA